MPPRIAIINTRAANLHSVAKALAKVGADASITSDGAELLRADAAVLPGVGASDAALRALDGQGLARPLAQFAHSGRTLLCVCLGMQILFERSEEGRLPGLAMLPGSVRRLPSGLRSRNGTRLKVPHMGWNSVQFTGPDSSRHPVFSGIPQGAHFYFVHSYHCVPAEPADVAATTDYGIEICAAVAHGGIVGTQFHPEKSGELGLQLYENFVKYAAQVAAR